jgi:hypothetical protein
LHHKIPKTKVLNLFDKKIMATDHETNEEVENIIKTTNVDNIHWDPFIEAQHNECCQPIVIANCMNMQNIHYYFIVKNNNQIRQSIQDIYNKLKCNTCHERLKFIAKLVHANNEPVFRMHDVDSPLFQAYADALLTRTPQHLHDIVGVHVLNKELLYPFTKGHCETTGECWKHVTIVSNIPDKYELTDEKLDTIQRLFNHHWPIMFASFNKYFTSNNIVQQIIRYKDIVAELDNGDKVQASCQWAFDHFHHVHNATILEKAEICFRSLLRAPFTKDRKTSSVSSPFWTQLSTILNRIHLSEIEIQHAFRRDYGVSAYKHRTAAPTDGQIKETLDRLPNFTNTLMRLSEIEHFGGHLFPKFGSINVLQSMLNKKRQQYQPQRMTIQELMDTDESIEISMQDKCPAFAVTSTLCNEINTTRYPFFWGFYIHNNMSKFGIDPNLNARVLGILPLGQKRGFPNGVPESVLFIMNGTKICSPLSTCCHTSNLVSDLERTCGAAYAELGRCTTLSIPNDTNEFVIGVGFSWIQANTTDFKNPILVFINGNPVHITGWGPAREVSEVAEAVATAVTNVVTAVII